MRLAYRYAPVLAVVQWAPKAHLFDWHELQLMFVSILTPGFPVGGHTSVRHRSVLRWFAGATQQYCVGRYDSTTRGGRNAPPRSTNCMTRWNTTERDPTL